MRLLADCFTTIFSWRVAAAMGFIGTMTALIGRKYEWLFINGVLMIIALCAAVYETEDKDE